MPDKIAKINVTSYNSNASEVTLESPLSFEELTVAVDNASSGGGGGGSAPFEVTFEYQGETGWTANKTFADILAAITAGPVYGIVNGEYNVKNVYMLSSYSNSLIRFVNTNIRWDDPSHMNYVSINTLIMQNTGEISQIGAELPVEG